MYTHTDIQSLASNILSNSDNLDGIAIHYLRTNKGATIFFTCTEGSYYSLHYSGIKEIYGTNINVSFFRGAYMSPILEKKNLTTFIDEMTNRLSSGSLIIDLNGVSIMEELITKDNPIQKVCLQVHEVLKPMIIKNNKYAEIIYWYNDFAIKLWEIRNDGEIDDINSLNLLYNNDN